MSDDIEKLGLLIHDSARLMRKRFDARASTYGLSSAQWRLLVRVAKEPGIAQARIAELLEIEPISVTRLVDRMEDAGWIERRSDPTDRRVRQLYPTEKSMAAFGAIKSVAGEVFEEALTGLDRTARLALIQGLMVLVDNLTDGETAATTQSDKAA